MTFGLDAFGTAAFGEQISAVLPPAGDTPPAYIAGSLSWAIGNGTTLTLPNYTVPAGTDKILIVAVMSRDSASDQPISAVFGSTPMQLVASSPNSNGRNTVKAFVLPVGDTTPTNNIVVTNGPGSVEDCRFGAFVISGASQSIAPIATTTTGLSYSISTNSVNNLLILASQTSSTFSPHQPDAADTIIGISSASGEANSGSIARRDAPTAATYTGTWTGSGTDATNLALAFAPVAGVGGGGVTPDDLTHNQAVDVFLVRDVFTVADAGAAQTVDGFAAIDVFPPQSLTHTSAIAAFSASDRLMPTNAGHTHGVDGWAAIDRLSGAGLTHAHHIDGVNSGAVAVFQDGVADHQVDAFVVRDILLPASTSHGHGADIFAARDLLVAATSAHAHKIADWVALDVLMAANLAHDHQADGWLARDTLAAASLAHSHLIDGLTDRSLFDAVQARPLGGARRGKGLGGAARTRTLGIAVRPPRLN